MEFKVRFRFNKRTGEVEEFVITDEQPLQLSEAEHNRVHDRIAAEVGNVIERNPLISEILPGTEPISGTVSTTPTDPEEETSIAQDEARRQAE